MTSKIIPRLSISDAISAALRSTPDRLRTIRYDLPALIDRRCNPAAYTSAVEGAYQTMWKKYCDAPQSSRTFQPVGNS
jgi:hypothetical protein